MPQDWQLRLCRRQMGLPCIFAGSEAEEMKDERVDGFIRERVLLLQQDSDEDVGCAGTFAADRALLCCYLTQS